MTEGSAAPPASSDDQQATLSERDVLSRLPGVRALLFRQTRDLEVTSDLTQEVMLSVIIAMRAGRIREPAALTAYVHQTARNTLSMHRRKMQPVIMEELPEQVPMWAERPLSPLERCEQVELNTMALAVLDELPTERDREIVRGFYVDGQDKPELMARLELSDRQFDRVISRARGRMRDLLLKKLNPDAAPVGEQPHSGVSEGQGYEVRR